jgi:DNA-binding response OmpR family regulator/DNA-binding CsgD family transcriptional regulator
VSSPASPHAGSRVLIIDDVPANIGLLRDVLTAAGFRVFVAESGESALEQAPFARPDIILVDVMMPGLDGFETCRRFKAMPEFAAVPLFFMTALTDTEDKLRGFEAGAVDYIGKPLHPQEVLARIKAHLEIRSLHAELERKNAELEERNERLDQAIQLRMKAEQDWARLFDRAIVIVARSGEIQFRTEPAATLLRKHFPAVPAGCLPSVLWGGVNPTPLRARQDGQVSGDLCLLVLEEEQPPPSPERLAPLGLTPRETEVLFWIAQGKTSAEIAVILESNVNTVKKHVQNLLPKLGVETRLAAALRATELLQVVRHRSS